MAGGLIEERVRAGIRILRERKGWTQGDLAEALRAHLPPDRQSWARQSNVSKYEVGTMDADLDTLAGMAAALGRPLIKLLPEQAVPPADPAAAGDAALGRRVRLLPQEAQAALLETLEAFERLAAAHAPPQSAASDPPARHAAGRRASRASRK